MDVAPLMGRGSGAVLRCPARPDAPLCCRDGLPYCEADYHAKFGIRCDGCEKYITGHVLEVSGWLVPRLWAHGSRPLWSVCGGLPPPRELALRIRRGFSGCLTGCLCRNPHP